jgi:hypothetical protein
MTQMYLDAQKEQTMTLSHRIDRDLVIRHHRR